MVRCESTGHARGVRWRSAQLLVLARAHFLKYGTLSPTTISTTKNYAKYASSGLLTGANS